MFRARFKTETPALVLDDDDVLGFDALTPCKLVGRCHGDSMFLRNVGIYRRIYTASKPTSSSSSSSP
jgi:hypothetical protein